MGSRTSLVLLFFWASIVVVAADISSGTERLTLPGTSSNDSCANADCQQGTCVPNDNVLVSLLFPYKCQCNPGWATVQKVVPLLQVPSLPCNVPNCSLNLNCSGDSPAAAPSPSSPLPSASASLCLVPGICGHGTCEVVTGGSLTSAIKCVCDPGYSNVLNTTGGYCINDCELKGGCSMLNLTLPGSSSPSPPGSASNQTATNTGCRGISFNSGLYITAILAVVWSFLY